MLEVLPNAPPGSVDLILQDSAGRCTPDRYGDCVIRLQITAAGAVADAEENLLAAQKANDPDTPSLYLARTGPYNGFSINPDWGPDPTGDRPAGAFLCTIGPRRLFSRVYQRAFTFCRGSQSFTTACLDAMPLGQTADLGSFVLSIFFEVDVSLQYIGNVFCFPLSNPVLCFKAVMGAEVPGCCGLWVSLDQCFGRPEQFNPQSGQTNRLVYQTNGCLDIISQDPDVVGGQKNATVQMNACCPDVVSISATGDTFRGTRFARPFNLAAEPAAAATSVCRITIEYPNETDYFSIRHTDTPRMGNLDALAKLWNGQSDISATSNFEWDAEINYTTRQRAPIALTGPTFNQSRVGGRLPPPAELFRIDGSPVIRGGTWKFTVYANNRGISLTRNNVRVVGENPPRESVQQRLVTTGNDAMWTEWLQRIACQESGQRQFATTENPRIYQYPNEPYMNEQGDGGFGLMQITNNVRCPGRGCMQDEDRWRWLWDWQANVDEEKRAFLREKVVAARRYPAVVEVSDGYLEAIRRTNRYRTERLGLPAYQFIYTPDYTRDQLIDDALRGYNGYNCETCGQWGMGIHEFRIRTYNVDGYGALIYTENERVEGGQWVADAHWDRVPMSERPNGDRNYVSNVRGQSPACPR